MQSGKRVKLRKKASNGARPLHREAQKPVRPAPPQGLPRTSRSKGEAEQQLRAVLEAAPCIISILRPDGALLYLNAFGEKVTGYAAREVIGRNCTEVFIADETIRKEITEDIEKVLTGRPTRGFESPVWCKDGSVRWFSWNSQALSDYGGEPAVLAVGVDITERKRAEEALRESETRTRALLDAIPDMMFRYRLDGKYLDFHAHDSRELVMAPEAILGAAVQELPVPAEVLGLILAASNRAVETGQVQTVEYTLALSGGLSTYEARIRASGPGEVVAVVRNITDRKRIEDELRRNQEELRALAAVLITAGEEATRRIALELHDDFSQKLAVLGLEVSALEEQLVSAPRPAVEKLREIERQISQLAGDVHQLSRQLHPSILHDLGLAAALRAECAAFSRQYGIAVEFQPDNVPEALPSEVALSLYRVVQESLRNIGKHTVAKKVSVTLASGDHEIRLAVADTGAGFDPATVKGKGGLGLISMEERVRLVNGRFSLRSQRGKGTRVEVRVPLLRNPL